MSIPVDARGPTPAVPAASEPSSEPALPRWLWLAVPALSLLAFGAVVPGYLTTEDFYFVPRYVLFPFGDTMRAQWLMDSTIDDPMGFLQFYRPLAYMWIHFKVWLWRGWIPGLRVDQLLLNAAVSLSLGLLALRWGLDRSTAAMAALLSVAAPGHMRLMTTVWGSNNLWAGLCALGCMLAMHRAIATNRYPPLLASLAAAAVGLLCYEQVIVVPVLAILCAYLLGAGSLRACVRPGAHVVALLGLYGAMRWAIFGGPGGYHTIEGNSLLALRSAPQLLLQLWETQQVLLLSVVTPLQPPVVQLPPAVGWATLGLWVAGVLFAWHRRPALGRPICCVLLWLFLTALPMAGLMEEPHHWATYPFFASLGSSLLLAMILPAVLPPRIQWPAATAVILVYVATTWMGLRIWWDTWDETRSFTTQLREHLPADRTPAIAYVHNLPGARPESTHFAFLAPLDHDAYTGYLPSRLYLRRTPVAWATGMPYSGVRPWPPADGLQMHWLDWNPTTRRLTSGTETAQPQPGIPVAWDLADPPAARAWRPAFQLTQVPEARPPAYITEGPYGLLLGPRLPPATGTPIYADVRMRITAPDPGRGIAEWHFRTADEPEPSPAHVIRFWTLQDGEVRDYRVPLVNNPQLLLDGPPTQVDLRPTGTPGAVVQILSIGLVPRSADAHD